MPEVDEIYHGMYALYKKLKARGLDVEFDENPLEDHYDPVIEVKIGDRVYEVWDRSGMCQVSCTKALGEGVHYLEEIVTSEIDPEYVLPLMVGIAKL